MLSSLSQFRATAEGVQKARKRCSQEKPEEIRRESGQLQTGNEGTNKTADGQKGQGPQDKEKLTDDNSVVKSQSFLLLIFLYLMSQSR